MLCVYDVIHLNVCIPSKCSHINKICSVPYMLENNKKSYKEQGQCFDKYLVEKSTESSQEFFLEEGDSRSCSVSVIRKEVLLRGVISLSSSWVELYAVCFLSCVPVWPCCLTTVVNPRSFFFETSLCFLSNSLGWFESKLVADC